MDNVHDHLKPLSVEERRNWYAKNSTDAAVAMVHSTGDFNLANVLRTANFFGFREMFYVGGSKSWDRRAAVGVHNYIPLIYCKTVEEFFSTIGDRYVPVALENNVEGRKTTDLMNFVWPLKPVIIVGEEQMGLTKDILDKIFYLVEIPSLGTVRSMNVGTAAGIAMSFYRQQNWPMGQNISLKV